MVIKSYTPNLKEDCLKIFDSNVPHLHSKSEREDFEHWLDHRAKDHFYVLYEKDRMVACGGIYIDRSEGTAGMVWGLVNAADYGKGYGHVITTYRLQTLIEKNTNQRINLSTSQHSCPYYRKWGLKQINFQKNGLAPGLDRYDFLLP